VRQYRLHPTTALIARARIVHPARLGTEFGVAIGGPVAVDTAAVKAR